MTNSSQKTIKCWSWMIPHHECCFCSEMVVGFVFINAKNDECIFLNAIYLLRAHLSIQYNLQVHISECNMTLGAYFSMQYDIECIFLNAMTLSTYFSIQYDIECTFLNLMMQYNLQVYISQCNELQVHISQCNISYKCTFINTIWPMSAYFSMQWIVNVHLSMHLYDMLSRQLTDIGKWGHMTITVHNYIIQWHMFPLWSAIIHRDFAKWAHCLLLPFHIYFIKSCISLVPEYLNTGVWVSNYNKGSFSSILIMTFIHVYYQSMPNAPVNMYWGGGLMGRDGDSDKVLTNHPPGSDMWCFSSIFLTLKMVEYIA